MVDSGVDAMVAEATVRYRASARFDDEIDLAATVVRVGTTSSVTAMNVERVADGATLVEGELRHVFVDVRTQEKTAIPQHVREGLARFGESEPETERVA